MIPTLISSFTATLLTAPMLAQETEYSASYSSEGHVSPVFWIIWVAVMLLLLISLWKMFTKAGQPGWATLIPIYNLYVMCKIAGRPGWWILLMLIPFVNVIIMIILYVDIAKNFGNSGLFAVGMILLPFIFFPILGLGSAQYQGGAAATA